MSTLALTPTQQRRLEKLASDAGRTPQAMLRRVLRDGFEVCELEVYESLAAQRGAARHGYVSHAEAGRRARAAIDGSIGNRHRQAA